MAKTTTYKPNRRGVAKYLRSEPVYQAVEKVASLGKGYAVSISPKDTGEYADSWQVSRTEVVVKGTRRAAAKLENTAGYAAAVEWGYAGRWNRLGKSAHRVAGKTLEFLRTLK